MTWILIKFCQMVEESHSFSLKKPRQNTSGTSLYPRHLSLHIFVPIILIFPYIFMLESPVQTYLQIRTNFRHIFREFLMGHNFDALRWVICAFQNELKMSQIDSSRDFGYVSILNRQKPPGIEYFTTKLP